MLTTVILICSSRFHIIHGAISALTYVKVNSWLQKWDLHYKELQYAVATYLVTMVLLK